MRINFDKNAATVELTGKMVETVKKDNWSLNECEDIIMHIKNQLSPQKVDIGRGFEFVGKTEKGTYMYTKMENAKKMNYEVDTKIWEDTKLIFEDAIKRNDAAEIYPNLQNLSVSLPSN